jgi:pyrroline-5-carboxylate reductase
MYKAGFIGCGNMGGALLRAVIKNAKAENCSVCEMQKEKAEPFVSMGVTFLDGKELCRQTKFIFLAVKPQVMESVLNSVSDAVSENEETVFVTMAAGLEIKKIEGYIGKKVPVIRIMPNLPCAYGEGVLLYCCNERVTKEERDEFLSLISGVGLVDEIEEEKIDAASVISGCGPAFVYLFASALAKGATACGLNKEKALSYAEQTLRGAAFVMQNSSCEVDELVRAVCSPKGTTIEGVETLEKEGFDEVIKKAVMASYNRSLELKKM